MVSPINVITKNTPIVDNNGLPQTVFMLKWQQVLTAIAGIPELALAASYPDIADDTKAATPAYVNAAVIAGGGAALTPSGSYPDDSSDTTAATPGYVAAARNAAEALIPALTHAAAYPSASDTTGATPAYVGDGVTAAETYAAAQASAAQAAAIAAIPAITHASGYPSASDTTTATPAYVSAAVAAGKPPLYDISMGIPAIGSFTVFGDGTSTFTVSALKAINIFNASSITGMAGYTHAAPSTPYRVRILMQNFGMTSPTSGNTVMCAGWYDGSKFQFLYMRTTGDLYVAGYTDYHTLDTTMFHSGLAYIPDDMWFGMRNDGTNLHFELSRDGVNFFTVYSAAITSYLANANNVFWGTINNGTNPFSCTLRCFDLNGLSANFP